MDLFSKRLLLVPVHLGTHWCLASINTAQLQITYYDTLHGKIQLAWKHWGNIFLRSHPTTLPPNGIVLLVKMFPDKQTIQTVVCLHVDLLGVWPTEALSTSVEVIWLALEDELY